VLIGFQADERALMFPSVLDCT